MCCRFYVDDDLPEEAAGELGIDFLPGKNWKKGARDIQVTDPSPAVCSNIGGEKLFLDEMRFGFPNPYHKGVVVNARQESVTEKPMFRESFETRRCLIPARAFYEWDREKQKVRFTREDGGIIYLAGCFERTEEGLYFVILTTAPNACMQGIHDRMPLMVERNEARDFILDGQAADELRKKPMPELIPHRPFEQMSFHF